MAKGSIFSFLDSSIYCNSESVKTLEYNPFLIFHLKTSALLPTMLLICKSNKTRRHQRDARLLVHAVF